MSVVLVRRALEKTLNRLRGDEQAMTAEGAGR